MFTRRMTECGNERFERGHGPQYIAAPPCGQWSFVTTGALQKPEAEVRSYAVAHAPTAPARPFARISPLAWVTFGLRVGGYLALLLIFPLNTDPFEYGVSRAVVAGFTSALFLLGVFAFFSRGERTFRTLLISHTAVSALTLMIAPLTPVVAIIHFAVLALAAGTHEKMPQSFVFSVGVALLTASIFLIRHEGEAGTAIGIMLVMVMLALPMSLMTHFREQIIPLQQQIRDLMSNVEHLTRANSLTQDYARDIEEESRNEERMKLARDIHDLVGYTFTNAIMMTEAAKVMTRQEPERIEAFMERIRVTMEDGLTEVKRALRDLRNQDAAPQPLDTAMRKLVRVFSISTGVHVQVEYGNTAWPRMESYADCVYHFVQEGLINAFRHGDASRVTIFLWDRDACHEVHIDDNGTGAPESITEGIGIAGMRERVEAHAGRLQINRSSTGFSITMALPNEEATCGQSAS